MARARNIKPSFFKNEDLADLDPFDRLLFIGLWCLADREGRLEYRPRRIKIELFPGDNYDVEIGLANLLDKGFIERYEVAGFSVISLPNFTRHQSPHSTEKDSELPDCNGYLTVNERARGKVIPGKQRLVHAETGACVDINNSALTVKTPEQSQSAPVDASTNNALNPDSLNPDYLNPEEDQETLVDSDESTTASDDLAGGEKPPTEERSEYSEDFNRFWSEYPRRHRSGAKKPAWRAWKARLRAGATVEERADPGSEELSRRDGRQGQRRDGVRQAAWRRSLAQRSPAGVRCELLPGGLALAKALPVHPTPGLPA
ncbi:hypothetical protein ACIRTP_30215 [Pseudomonas aeruginosa]|uniref:hypothetical protein n=1 Tax=Pseudomonas aeruginosa TaxID=287 RepID=UPI003D9B23A3